MGPERSDDDPLAGLGATIVPAPRPEIAAPAAAPRAIQVEVIGGPMDGERCRVEGDCLTLGRGKANDLLLAFDPTVSARHARIVREGPRFWLEDLDSSNGTFVGEERVRGRAALGPGTQFVAGATRVEFLPC